MERTENKIYENPANTALLNLIPHSARFILDVGCGTGNNARILKEKGVIVDGITLSVEEIKIATKYCRTVIMHNLENGLPEQLESNYDVVFCSHILEHIAYPEKLLSDIRGKLKKDDAVLLVALPNFMSYRNRLRMIIGNFNYEKYGTMDYTHLRWYTYKSSIMMLEGNGFEIINSFAERTLPWRTVLGHLPSSFQNIISTGLIRVSKGLFGSQFVFIAKLKK